MNCVECRDEFIWIDGTPTVLDYWGSAQDPANGEYCVRLRQEFNGRLAWAGTPCNDNLKYICKSGKYI